MAVGSLRRRGSVVSLHSIASFALSIGQKKAWKELSRELHRNGITADMIKAKKEEICKLFRTGSIRSFFSGQPDGEGVLQGSETKQEGTQANKIRWASLDGMMARLSLPAMRAYVVAGLVGSTIALHRQLRRAIPRSSKYCWTGVQTLMPQLQPTAQIGPHFIEQLWRTTSGW